METPPVCACFGANAAFFVGLTRECPGAVASHRWSPLALRRWRPRHRALARGATSADV
ncbi:hypothetical protein [Allostreptomyces psammosilenae]|uniref:Uncharacterized protein n=1 Tax=Allostreptomyces psammosilenae TaxID=1892865 RepID=A0A852ZVL3_9ACTN|nr:hypothetical protein [Allostreptomyces psammosilenae]NYI04824.1 hypothetical protein [Allostreptomyces psammosilenae]